MSQICVVIGRGRHASLLEEWHGAASAGAQLCELRIDCLRRDPDLKRIFKDRPTPAIFTIRRGADGGLWRGDEEKRQRLIREAIVAGIEYVDLELDVAQKLPRPRFGNTKRIVSVHNFREMPDLDDVAEMMLEADPDILKIAAVAKTVAEASRMLDFVKRFNEKIPTIGLAMGTLGVFTRVLGAKFGSPHTYAGFNPDRTFAPGMIRMQELRRDYHYEQIDAGTEIFAVIGDPIGHSLSPAVHNNAFRHLGLNKVLVPLHIPDGTLKESLQALDWLQIRGMSVTIPHKEAILPLLSRRDRTVEQIGACNTVLRDDDGSLVGHNTDLTAAISSLEDALRAAGADLRQPLLDKQVLVLGTGGVARTLVAGLSKSGAGAIVCGRSEDKAAKLAEEFDCRSVPWGARASTLCDVIINGTPVGMHPDVDSSPVPPSTFREGMLAFDTIYRPENTLFLKLAREHNCATVSGVDMFVRQAALQFQYYSGQEAPEDLMREIVRRRLSAAQED